MTTETTAPTNDAVLVAGAGGVVGRSVVEHFARTGVTTRGISRRAPQGVSGWTHLPVDLLDADAAVEGLRAASDTTRLAFAAYIEKADLAEQIGPNVALLEHTLDALDRLGAPLRHVTLYQGMKYYGAHLGRFTTPAKEDDPRLLVPNFYYDQEDLLRERAAQRGFALTVFRPEAVMGYAQGTPMNLLMAIGTYVAMTRELGLPLRFPGQRETYDRILYQMTDAELLARATDWAGSAPTAAGEAFNITNGDVVRWSHLWKRLADHFGLELGEPQTLPLATVMPPREDLWNRMVERHGLVPTPYTELVDWRFGDMILGSTWDNVSNVIKLRQAGFGACHDSADRLVELLDDLGRRRILPAAPGVEVQPV
ncbi:SDR family oxidoreductase [Curtobacterium sp. MCBD17_040]|uniref:SDR family oxidoreductase n=1 Tax=Curtobacterium sp. MCBD17_040 TaxID=2175674 RepID=UPI000DA8958C|nr:SDR family oxidoreductase [Curtobacterium sp. MCBD17_040]WIB64578.1 SDR family oxidoreductase [Curtobacterium sp. MCBD17_040]